jgi:hypothetical protein
VGTRARIGIQNADGSILSVYHHWDGYPDWLGIRLVESYSDEKKLKELIDGGDISTLESDQNWQREPVDYPIILRYKDRGEDCPPQKSPTVSDYWELARECGAVYAYLYKDGEWLCRNIGAEKYEKIPTE